MNVPPGLSEVAVDSSFGNSCYYRLEAGERYVIFAWKAQASTGMLRTNVCARNFRVQENKHIVAALRDVSRSGPSNIVGRVLKSSGEYTREGGLAGVRIVAQSESNRYEAMTNSSGNYRIADVSPGRYSFRVAREGYVPDEVFNQRWSGRLIANSVGRIEPDPASRGTVVISGHSCEVWDLGMWPAGRILGTVYAIDGTPLEGIKVQAYQIDSKGKRESRALRAAVSDRAGAYLLAPLPAGEYVIGVNADLYFDAEAYPPTVYVAPGGTPAGTRVRLEESGERARIDFTLPPKRSVLSLRVHVTGEEGNPQSGVNIFLENRAGVQRWYSKETTNREGWMDVPVYSGEEYVVKAFDSRFDRKSNNFLSLEGRAAFKAGLDSPSLSIKLTPKTR